MPFPGEMSRRGEGAGPARRPAQDQGLTLRRALKVTFPGRPTAAGRRRADAAGTQLDPTAAVEVREGLPVLHRLFS